jgi:hypothetical protein
MDRRSEGVGALPRRFQGVRVRPPDRCPLSFALRSRVLLLRHDPSGIDVDISLGALPFTEEAIARAVEGKVGKIRLPYPHLKTL